MRRRTLAIGAVVLAGAALVLFCCTGHGDRPANTAAESSATSPSSMAPSTPSPAPTATAATNAGPLPAADGTGPNDDGGPAPSASGPAPSSSAPHAGPGTRIAEAVQAADPRDLELLAAIERDTKRDPPPEIHALIAARKRGATRDELVRDARTLPDLRLRAYALRWIDGFAPKPDAGLR